MKSELGLDAQLLKRVGGTPVTPLTNLDTRGMKLHGKLEWFNPFGSVKDRAAYWMIRRAEWEGRLKEGQTVIIEPTSGNTGIALAGIARILGYDVEIVVPTRTSAGSRAVLRSLGAKVVVAEDGLFPGVGRGTDQAIALARETVRRRPERYFMPNQFENEANYRAHYEGTGPEVWRELGGSLTYLVVGSGTGGTVTGVAQYLKERRGDIRVYGVQPQPGHHLQGLRSLKESVLPKVLERRMHLVDEWIEVSDADAFNTVGMMAEREGMLVGPSSGAIIHAALRVAREVGDGVGLAVLPDDGRKYRGVFDQFRVFSDEGFDRLKSTARLLPELAFDVSRIEAT